MQATLNTIIDSPRFQRDVQAHPGPIYVTRADLLDMLANLKGATFGTITAETDPRMVKKHRETGEPNPHLGALKVSRVNVTIGADYERSVNRQRTREELDADFASMGLPDYYEPVSGPVIRHTGKGTHYLACKPENCLSVVYMDAAGKLIDADDIKPYLPASRKPANQGTAKEIVWRTYSLDSIREISLGGHHYIVRD